MTIRLGGYSRIAAGLVACATMAAPALAQDKPYYEGKTITVVVGLAPGGTVDTFVRILAPIWASHIEGNPTMIVQNIEGSGGLRATNFVYEVAEPDGLTVYWGPWSPVNQVLSLDSFRADYTGFEFLGGLANKRVTYVRTDVVDGGLTDPAQIVDAPEFVVGGNNLSGTSDLLARFGFDVMGAKYNYALGFGGGSEIFGAIQRGEVDAHNTAYNTYRRRAKDMIADGVVTGLWYFVPVAADGSYETIPEIEGFKPFVEVYQDAFGTPPSGPVWDAFNWFVTVNEQLGHIGVAPPGTDPAAVEALRDGLKAAFASPEYQEAIQRTDPGNIDQYVPVDVGEAVLAQLNAVTPEIIETLRKYLDEGSK